MKYVTMEDTLFSDWGPATNKINALTIACETTAQAKQIAATLRTTVRREKSFARKLLNAEETTILSVSKTTRESRNISSAPTLSMA